MAVAALLAEGVLDTPRRTGGRADTRYHLLNEAHPHDCPSGGVGARWGRPWSVDGTTDGPPVLSRQRLGNRCPLRGAAQVPAGTVRPRWCSRSSPCAPGFSCGAPSRIKLRHHPQPAEWLTFQRIGVTPTGRRRRTSPTGCQRPSRRTGRRGRRGGWRWSGKHRGGGDSVARASRRGRRGRLL